MKLYLGVRTIAGIKNLWFDFTDLTNHKMDIKDEESFNYIYYNLDKSYHV